MSPPKDGDGIDGRFAALLSAETQGSQVADDHDNDRRDVIHFSPKEGRRLLNLLDVADQLQTFKEDEKLRLISLIEDQPTLHAMVQGREFSAKTIKVVRRLCMHFVAILGGLTAIFEFWSHLQTWMHMWAHRT